MAEYGTFWVIEERICAECQGAGMVSNGAFDLVWTVWTERPEPRPSLEEVAYEEGFDAVPPEEVACTRCGGAGVERMEVPLERALVALGMKLAVELRDVLEVAIARGEQLGYEDEDYRERLVMLGGRVEDELESAASYESGCARGRGGHVNVSIA